MVVDEVRQDRVRRPDRLAPQVGRLADHLVRVLAGRQAHDPDVRQADAGIPPKRLHLRDERGQLAHPECAGALACGIHVVRESDLLGVARQQRDLARSQRRAERGHDIVEAGLMGHQGVGVTLDDHGLAALADG